MLKNKSVVISGASSGIGRAAAYACLAQGAKLTLHHIGTTLSEADVQEMRKDMPEDRVVFVAGDITQAQTASDIVNQAVQTYGRIDVLVSNAGICQFSEFLDVSPDMLKKHMDVNYIGAYLLIQACANQMKLQNQGGSIIAVSSISALVGGGQQTHYTPTKAALLSLMQSCAVALGPYGIRCNAVLPGTIQTALNKEDLQDEAKRNYMAGRCSLGRLGVPEDIAGPIVFLASDMSSYMTGSQLLVDGIRSHDQLDQGSLMLGGLFVNLQ